MTLPRCLWIALSLFPFMAFGATASADFTPQAGIMILDMTSRNVTESETDGDYARQLYSATYMCDIAGNPYAVTSDLREAMTGAVMLLSSDLTSTSFTADELRGLIDWVQDGGVLLAPALRTVPDSLAPLLSDLFGIDASAMPGRTNAHLRLLWNPAYADDAELAYFDEAEERETAIGSIKTFPIAATTADVLAAFPDSTAAVVRHPLGRGAAYLVGLLWRNVIQRNQLNKDSEASRCYNNGFEPSADVWPFLLRSIYAKTVGVSVWKFTVPDGYLQVLVPTHDCDSRTAYDAMHFMGNFEQSIGLRGHYFFTAHYYSDKENFGNSYLSAFYNEETIPEATELLAQGHTGGSHSIGHFPDFNLCQNTDTVTLDEYALRATCVDGTSTGVSTWAEIVMSKQILERDLHNTVRSFRSGHLCVNADFNRMLEAGGYDFASCYTAGDLLSEFPFFGRIGNAWGEAQSRVLQLPLHISDVYNNKSGKESLTDDTWETHEAVSDWVGAMRKLRGNYASAILLIHPNRAWKMTLEQRLVDSLNLQQVGLYNFEDYGDFWKTRFATDFQYAYDAQTRLVTIRTDLAAVDRQKLTFAIDATAPIDTVLLYDSATADVRRCTLRRIAPTRYLLLPEGFESHPTSGRSTVAAPMPSFAVTAVPTSGAWCIEGQGPFRVSTLSGLCIRTLDDSAPKRMLDVSTWAAGCYVVTSVATGQSVKIVR